MSRNWLTLIVSLVLWLRRPSAIHAAPQSPEGISTKELPAVLYRGDSRSPEEIEAQGGFHLRDPSMEFESGFSVVLHVKGVPPSGRSPDNTVYVSTTDDPLVAARFLRGEDGWIYKIHGAPRIFSVADTLQKWYEYPFPVSSQREFVAMGGVPWGQIQEHAFLPATDSGVVKEDTVFEFKPNPGYDGSYNSLTVGEGRPELAGFNEVKGHPANEDPFFKELQAEGTLKDRGLKFLGEAAEDAVKWTGKAPLLPPPPPQSARPAGKSRKKNRCTISKRSPFRDLCDDDIEEKRPTGTQSRTEENVPKERDLVAIAEKRSKEMFDGLLDKFGHGNVREFQDKLHAELNGRMHEFRKLPRLERITGLAKTVGTALEVGGLALYGAAVSETLSSDASVLDKAAVVTSILPIIGCSVRAADDAKRGDFDAVETALCFTEDGLTLAGFGEVALLLRIVDGILNLFKHAQDGNELYDRGYFVERRREGWGKRVSEVEWYIGSVEFMTIVTNIFSAYQVGVLFQATQLVGDLHAAHAHQLALAQPKGPTAGKDPAMANPDLAKDINAALQQAVDREVCAQAARNKIRTQRLLKKLMLKAANKLHEESSFGGYFKVALGFSPIHRFSKSEGGPIKAAVKKAFDRLETPDSCNDATKTRRASFAHVQFPREAGVSGG